MPENLQSKPLISSNFFKNLKPFEVDELINTQHEYVFSYINCLDCANCCKTTPALLEQEDVNRISKYLKISAKQFIQQYTQKDADGDTVFRKTPCVFLNKDNTCAIYDMRPFACKDYPHTHRKNQLKIITITEKNISICPAVKEIFSNSLME
jgi:Fe-S-cluster containining protein